MTIPDVGRCIGSGGPPVAGSTEEGAAQATAICPACSGMFELRDGTMAEHAPAPEEERVVLFDESVEGGPAAD